MDLMPVESTIDPETGVELIIKLLVIAAAYYYKTRKRKKPVSSPRVCGVRPVFRERKEKGEYMNLFQKIKHNKKERKMKQKLFFTYTRMNVKTFDKLLGLVHDKLVKTCRTSLVLGPEERLALTLRYLTTGDSMQSVGWTYRVSKQAVSLIVPETCKILWDVLQPIYLAPPTRKKWKEIADEFLERWNLPHCVGSVDGKHIIMQCPKNFGSLAYNYKKSHSIILMAVCDADYKFTFVDIGAYGASGDSTVFRESDLGHALMNGTLNLPFSDNLPGTNTKFPYFIVGDEAFPLKDNLMRPYPGQNNSREKLIFNYRLSRARRTIENTFGIMASRWRIFHRSIYAKIETIELITKACVVLHNYVMCHSSRGMYCPPSFIDVDDHDEINRNTAEWRKEMKEGCALQGVGRVGSNNNKRNFNEMRDKLRDYLCSPVGSVPWQDEMITRGSEPGYVG